MQSEARRLVLAILTDDVEALEPLLRQAIAAQAAPARIRDDERRSLLELAIRRNQPQALDVLLTYGCGRQDDGGNPGVASEDDVAAGVWEPSPLCLALELGYDDCVRVLLAHGASVDAPSRRDGTHHTALHVAAMFDLADGFFHGAVLASSCVVDAPDLSENTPLHLAAAYGSYDVALALLHAGADVNARNASGSTPLHLASANGVVPIVELLLDHSADVNALDVLGNTPLIDAAFVSQSTVGHFACGDATSQSQVIRLLLSQGAAMDTCNRDGNPAICGAVRNGYKDAVFALLDGGASVTQINRNNESVLHVAARAGVTSVEIWKRLLVGGADVLARDRYDRTCYCIWMARPKMPADERPEDEQDEINRGRSTGNAEDDDPVAFMLEAAIMAR